MCNEEECGRILLKAGCILKVGIVEFRLMCDKVDYRAVSDKSDCSLRLLSVDCTIRVSVVRILLTGGYTITVNVVDYREAVNV